MRRLSSVVLLVALVAAASGCGSDTKEVGNGAEYVALGDSYTAAPGMAPVADNSCRRSKINYPSLVDKALRIKSFSDRSCAGSRTDNLEKPQTYQDPTTHLQVKVNEPQLNAVGKDTKLVTIGLLLICTTPGAPEPNETCRQYLEKPQSDIEEQIRQAAANLKESLATIAQKAPEARIVVVGYPRLVPDQGSCGSVGHREDRLPVPEAQVTRMREAMKFVNGVWSETAQQAGALYVDTYTPSQGHDICSDDPWISGYLGVPGKALGLHPLPAYEEAVSRAIVTLLKSE